MKKITLFLAAAMVAIGSNAQTSRFMGEVMKKKATFSQMAQKKALNMTQVEKAEVIQQQEGRTDLHQMVKARKAATRAGESAEAYLYTGYTYSPLWQLPFSTCMNLANIAVEGNTVKADFYGGLEPVNGTILPVSGNGYLTQEEADSVVFNNNQIVGYTEDGKACYMRKIDFTYNELTEACDITLLDGPIGGYYATDEESGIKKMYIVDCFAIFPEGSKTPLDYSAVGRVDCINYDFLASHIVPAKIEAQSHWGEQANYTAEGAMMIFNDYVCIQSLAVNPSWMTGTMLDESTLQIDPNQMVITTYKERPAEISNYNVTISGDKVNFPDYEYTLKMSEDENNYYFKGSNDSYLGFYLVAADNVSGWLNIYTGVTITVSKEDTPVMGIEEGATSRIEYFDLTGRPTSAQSKGMKIKKEFMSNGKVKSTKLL